jgi:hypothetical protein
MPSTWTPVAATGQIVQAGTWIREALSTAIVKGFLGGTLATPAGMAQLLTTKLQATAGIDPTSVTVWYPGDPSLPAWPSDPHIASDFHVQWESTVAAPLLPGFDGYWIGS